jgi:hypothetical protein
MKYLIALILSLFSFSIGFSQNEVESDRLVSNDSLTKKTIYTRASFPGGSEALSKYLRNHLHKLRAPAEYRKTGQLYQVRVSYVVEKNGSISDVLISEKNRMELDPLKQERIIEAFEQMPKWSPSKTDGVPVACRYLTPISL